MSLQYRPEIDGLRAISVLAVILYHADFAFRGADTFKGGFFGVDVFFVISGYLITLIVLREISQETFSFATFYERRSRRILLPLLVVMAASIPFAWALMPPQPMKEFAGSALSALGFGSNVWFLLEDSYTAEASELKPLLHTWSLSVEEQFYLIFPAFALVAWRFGRRQLLLLIALALLLSLQFAQIGSENAPDATFYLLPTRAWELLAGALLAKLELDRGRGWPSNLAAPMSAVGVALILFSFSHYDDSILHPSFITVTPVLGATLVIWFSKEGNSVYKILSSKPLVAIGLISYSLYLWHFPIFAFARLNSDDLSDLNKFASIFLTFVLAISTYYLIEKPARSKVFLNRRSFIAVTTIIFAAVFSSYSYIYRTDGAVSRYDQISKLINITYWGNDDTFERYHDYATYYGCWVWIENRNYNPTDPFGACRNQEGRNNQRKIMVIGDSHAAGLVPGLIDHFGRQSVVQRTASTCFPSPNVRTGSKSAPRDYCLLEMKQAYADIENLNPDLILIAGNWRLGNDGNIRHEDFLRKDLPRLLANFKDKAVLIGPLVRWEKGGLRKQLIEIYASSGSIPSRIAPSNETFLLDTKLAAISKDIGLRYLSPAKVFCDGGTCITKVSDLPEAVTSWDRAHISIEASKFLIARSLNLLEF